MHSKAKEVQTPQVGSRLKRVEKKIKKVGGKREISVFKYVEMCDLWVVCVCVVIGGRVAF